MKSLLLNFFFGLFPAIALAWSVAADERKPADERVVSSSVDRRQQNTIFALVYGLWAATLAMWNWMRGEWRGWAVLWLVLAAGALLLCRFLAVRARVGSR